VSAAVDREITALGIEHDEQGNRAKAYLYCLETRCPHTGWMVPLAPSWIVSKQRNVIAKLIPNYEQKRFEIEEVDSDEVMAHLRDLVPDYHRRREDLMVCCQYITQKRKQRFPEEASAAGILLALIRNERLG